MAKLKRAEMAKSHFCYLSVLDPKRMKVNIHMRQSAKEAEIYDNLLVRNVSAAFRDFMKTPFSCCIKFKNASCKMKN